jgi:hypothetical protein
MPQDDCNDFLKKIKHLNNETWKEKSIKEK